MYKYLITILLLVFFISCDTTKPVTDKGTATPKKEQNVAVKSSQDIPDVPCGTTAFVKDFSGTDGCQFLFELEDGTKLLPLAMPKIDFEFRNNQLIKIGYVEVKDAMSVCMAEDKAVNIGCIELVTQTGGPKPAKGGCVKLNAPFDASWMKDLVIRHKPRKIDRYDYLDGYAYHLKNDTHAYLYDCTGTKLCDVEGKASNDCTKQIKQLKGKFTIWVVNN